MKMIYKVSVERCIACGKCEEICRFDAIYFDGPGNGKFEKTFRIDPIAWDDEAARWHISTTDGDEYVARHYVMATGCLSVPKDPDIEGHERFRGARYFTGKWPHEKVDFTGRRVAVIGTGSSAIQGLEAEKRKWETIHPSEPFAGQVIVQGDLVGVARTPIAASALGSLAVTGNCGKRAGAVERVSTKRRGPSTPSRTS